jgi:septal ring factor EnvC (AmiA/AmiB activator)
MAKQSRKKSLIAVSLIANLLLAITFATPVLADEEQEKRQQLEKLSSEMNELKKLLAEFKGQRSELQDSLQKSEVNIGDIQKKINDIKKKLNSEQTELKALQQNLQTLNQSKRSQEKYIEQQILAAYQIGQQKKIKVLLNQEQPEKLNRALTYYDYFNQARSEQINNYVAVINELNQLEPQITAKTVSLTQVKSQLDKEYKSLLSKQQSREKLLASINSSISSKDQQLIQLDKDRKELEKLLAAVEQTIANIAIPSDYNPFTSLKGKLPWPTKGKLSNTFGSRRNNSNTPWQGINIQANEGSEVQAIHHGRVVFADWFRGSGLLIIIDHGDGYMSLYAHNQSLYKEPGEWVNSGETIATVGNSGGQKLAGLYFEIRHNGQPTNPQLWCRKA